MAGNINNFIKEYQATNDMCDDIIKFYKLNEDKAGPGVTGRFIEEEGFIPNAVDKNMKDSMDITISKYDIRRVSLEYGDFLFEAIGDYIKTVCWDNDKGGSAGMELFDAVNIQYYKPGGGYKEHHCERNCAQNSNRELAWMTYLTDTPNGGTAFPQWDFTSECTKGKTLIWPAGFTHYHHGIISDTHEKMIITGWVIWTPPMTSEDGS